MGHMRVWSKIWKSIYVRFSIHPCLNFHNLVLILITHNSQFLIHNSHLFLISIKLLFGTQTWTQFLVCKKQNNTQTMETMLERLLTFLPHMNPNLKEKKNAKVKKEKKIKEKKKFLSHKINPKNEAKRSQF